jgi:hypothetical protein
MGLDIRWPIGLLFVIFGVLLAGFGLASDAALYQRSLGVNVSLWWGRDDGLRAVMSSSRCGARTRRVTRRPRPARAPLKRDDGVALRPALPARSRLHRAAAQRT